MCPTHSQPHFNRLCANFTWTLNTIYSTGGLPYWDIQRYESQQLTSKIKSSCWEKNLETCLVCNQMSHESKFICSEIDSAHTHQINIESFSFLPEASFGLRVLSSPVSMCLSVCPRVCICICVCVRACVCQSLACPHDNLSPVQARITKFGPEKHLIKKSINYWRDKPSASISFVIAKAIFLTYLRFFVSQLVRPCHNLSETIASYRSNRSPLLIMLTVLTFCCKSFNSNLLLTQKSHTDL